MPVSPARFSIVIVASTSILAACAAGSSGGGSGAESGAQSGGGRSDCDASNEFDIQVDTISPVASRVGIKKQTAPDAALHLALTQGNFPYFGGSGGSGLVGKGFPADGWARTSRSGARVTFQAPSTSGAAEVVLTRVDGRWLVSHAEFGC